MFQLMADVNQSCLKNFLSTRNTDCITGDVSRGCVKLFCVEM